MSFIDDSIKRLREEEKERRKREQAAQLIRGPQSSSNSNSTNSSTSSRNSSQTSQGGSQSPSAVDKLFHSTARKYSNATANDPTRRNSRGQEVSSRTRTRSAVNSPKATGTKIKEDTGEWAKNEAYGALTGFNKELASAADFLLPDVITPKKVQNVLDYYRNADEEQQQKVQASRGDSKLREIAGTIGGEMLKNIPAAAMAMLSGGTSVGAQVAGKAVPSLLEGAQIARTGNIVQRAMSEVARTSGQNPMFWETFMRTVGPTYDNEIQNGADPVRATLSAYANALLNAQIEIGGGVEVYDPSEVFWKAALRSAKEEGLEEVQQYAVENLTNKAIGSNTAKWFSMNRGEDAVINPIDMAEQGFYGAAAGGLMSGGRTLGVNAVNSIRNDNYRNANPDLEERANELIQRASLQGREGEMATRAQNLAEEVSDQMARGKAPTAYQMRELESAVATDEYYNQKAYESSSQERYNQAVEEGKADTVKQTGTADEYYGFRRGLNETEQRNYDKAKAVMGENASENSVVAVGRLMTGSESNRDIDTILLDPEARSAVEELADVTLPINNTKARAELENLALAHNIANSDRILEETHNEIRTNMSRRGGEFFDQNYDEAVATIDEPNAANIYENFFSRFYTAGTVEGADFEKTYNRIISPLVEDFGEELGTKISQVFNHDFAQKVFAEGQIAMNSVRAKAQGKRLSVKASENPAGFTYEAEARKHISDKEAELFTKLAERAKVHIRLVSSIAGGKANGSYDPETGVILIAADSDNKFITVFKHELTHHLKNTSPEMYQKLEDFVFKRWYDGDPEKMEERVQEYQRRYGMKPDEAREEIIADASEAFFTDQGAINDAVTFNEKMARAIHDGIKSLLDTFLDLVDTDRRADKGYGDFLEDLDILRDAEKMWLEALNESVGRSKASAESGTFVDNATGENVQFSLRTEAPPKKTRKGYKVFVVKNGELYPPMVANPNGEPTPVGVWLNADEGVRAGTSKTGRPQVKAGGKGTQGGSGTLAYRPGWHLGEMPLAQQFARKDSQGNKTLFPSNFVWAECDIAADNDYQEEAMSYGYTENGKFRHAYAGLPRIPKDGFYQYRTNPDPNTVPWLITGAMKINRILSDAEVRDILAEKGIEAPKRQGGDKTLEELGIKKVKFSLKDSDGNTLSKGQQEYFKDSKARDENGNLLVLYHGTENAGFTIFDSEAGISSPAFFFTNNLEIAKGYSGTHDIARMPSFKSVEAVQKAIKNDMDADIEIRKEDGKYVMYEDGDYVDESRNLNDLYNLYNQYSGFGGTSSNYKVYLNVTNPLIVDAKGKSWDDITTDFSDEPMTSNAIAEYAKENGYDGVVIRNVVDAGLYNSSGEYKTGTDVIAFNPEQIKDIDNKNPSKDPDIRFSMKTPVEETRKMIAWHNINSSNIDGVLELGGLAMPSFAIKPSDIGHGTYGDISIIASKDSIDPKVSKSQMIFGGDAWTPMFPDVNIKASEKVAKRIDERLKGILGIKRSNELPGNLRYPAIDTSNLQDQLQRWGDPYNAYGKNAVLRLAYVMNGLGKQYSLPMKEGNLGGYDKAFWELVDDRLPKKSIQEFINEDVMQYEPILRDIMYETYGKAFDEKFKGKKMKLSNPYKKELSWGEVDRIIYDLNTYRKIGIKPDVDTVALENDLDNIIQENEDGYKRWIDELFDGVIEKKGVRNNKDMFTPSGSRRSWESLHDDYNLANIVKAMKGQSKQGNNSMFTTAGNVKGAALKSYSDIEDVRRDLGRIAPEESEEIKSKYDQFTEDTRVLANRIADDPFSGSEMLADILSHAKTEASIYRFLNREYDFLRTQNHLDLKTLATDIYNLGQLANTLPMEYFESKIYRAYPLQEALAIVVPDNLDSKTVDKIKEYNGNILTYKAGNEEDRLAKVNSVEGAKFSLKKDPAQLDFFDMLKSKGVDDENARIGSEALADTGKLKSKSKSKKKKSPYNTLAVSFYEKMIQDGSATLVGHKFKNKHDLAQALQMYRDPRYETCRLFFLDKNNKIVMQTGVTQRLPSMSAIFAGTTNEENERYISNVLNSATKRGAVAFYTSHNHPSGNPEPSRDDYGVNRRFKSLADQSNGKLKYRGQIVIDHNTYAYISPGKTPSNFGEGADIYSMYSAKKAEDPLHKTDDESKRMGMNQQLRNQNAIADLLMSLNVPEDHATLVYLSTQLRGKAIQSMDLDHFAESDSYHIRQELIKNAKDFGAYAVALGMNETNDARTRLILEDLYENGALLDVFIYDKNNGYTNFDADDSKQRGWGSLWDEEARNAPEQVGEQFKYSLKSNGESRSYQSTITKLENQVKDLKSEFKRTNLKTADQRDVRIQAGKLITRHGSNMQAQKSLIDTFNEIFRLYKEKGTDAFDEVYEIAKNEAVNIVNNISVVHNEGEETYKAIKDYLRNTPIAISEDMKRNITDFNDFRKRYFGKLKITNGNTTNIDTVYMELMELFPEQFTEDYVNPADQLYHMADVLDNYAPYYETLDGASEEMQDYVVDIASDIMETAYGLQTKKTFADKKYEEKVRAVEKARQKALESRDVALDRQKKRYEKKLNDLKQHNRDVREGRRERKEESELRSKLLKVARRLDKMKTTKENRTLIQNLIGDMDLVAKSMTGKTLNDLNDLRNWYDEQKEADPFFYDSNVEAKLKRLTKKQIANMDLNDVRDLNEVLRAIETSIRNADKFLKSYYNKSVKKAGLEVIEDVNNSKGVKDNPLGTIDRFFINGTLSPERQIHRITGYNDNDPLYVATKELSKGQRDMLFYQMNSWNMFKKFMKDKQFINSLNGKKAREIELSAISKDKETTIKVTPDVAISLYLSSMNDDNMRHMGVGGVEIPDIKAYKNGELKKAYRNSTRVTFSKEQLAAIEGSLTKQEKAFADTAHEYYNSVAPKAINEVSEILKGYSLAQVENYFPIQVNKNFLDRDFESLKFDGTIEGMGSLKERVKASNPIVINGIVDTITRSINENSMYVGLAIPVRNYSKLLGVKNITYTESDRGGKTETKVEYNGSVNESISKKWGDQAMKYIEKFMTDLQTSRGSDDDWEAVLNKWRSNYAGAVLTLNASVAIKQAASYPTAMAVLGAKPLARAMADVGKVDLDLIEKYTPLQWYRSQGYSTKELGDIRAGRKGSAVDKLTSVPILNWIQAMDVLTTRKLWKASEYYVRQNNRSLKQGSDEYYKAVADIYNRVIEETQPNYTVMQRPGLLRSDKSMVQMLNMFKTQPYQNFNILYDSIGNYKAKAKVYKKDKSTKAQADVKKAYKDMQNAVLSQVLQLAVFAAMTSLWALFRGKDDKWRDEEGKLSIESYMKQLGKDMLSGSAAMIPLGADLYNAISSAITGDYYYGFSSVTDSSISDLFNSLNQTMTLIPSVAEYAKERRPGEPIPDDLKKSSKKLLENTSRFSGIPYSNLRNLWDGVYRWVAIAGHGEYVGEYLSQKATFAKTSVMMDNLYKAYRNDKAQYDELRQMMIDDGIKESSIDYAMKDRMKKNKTEAEQKEYDDSISTLEKSALWKDADAEDKEDYEKILEKIAVGIEDSDTTPYTKYAASGLTEEQIILYKLALKKVDTPNKNGELGGTPTKTEREAAVRLLEKEFNLTYAQKEALKG